MILYYTASQKTKILAEALGGLLRLSPRELKSPLNGQKLFWLRAGWLGLTGGEAGVSDMPASVGGGPVYLCAPVWAGRIAAPALYFLRHADLRGMTVSILLTCMTPDEAYRKRADKLLDATDCVKGSVLMFATGGEGLPERDVLREQLKNMLGLAG